MKPKHKMRISTTLAFLVLSTQFALAELNKKEILSIINSAGYAKVKKGAVKTGEKRTTNSYVKSTGAPLPLPGKQDRTVGKVAKKKSLPFGTLPPIPPSEVELAQKYATAFQDNVTARELRKSRKMFQNKARAMNFRRGDDSRGDGVSYNGRKVNVLSYY